MEYIKIKTSFKNYPSRLNRTIAIREDIDLLSLGYIIAHCYNAWFEHLYYFEKGNKQYVVEDWLIDAWDVANTFSLKDHYLSELGDSFTYIYDSGEYYAFNCKVLKRKYETFEFDEDDDSPIAFVIDGVGQGIFENDIYSLLSYLNGEVDREFVEDENEDYDHEPISLPINMFFDKMGDFDNPLDLEEYILYKDSIEISLKEMFDVEKTNYKQNDYQSLKREIDDLINQSEDKVSLLIKNLDNNETILDYKANDKLVSASTIKICIMLYAFELTLKGEIDLEEIIHIDESDILDDTKIFRVYNEASIFELIVWMIIESDNTATNILIKKLDMKKINQYIKNSLCANNTYIERYMLDYDAMHQWLNNYMSHNDMYEIFYKLYNREILNDFMCDLAIRILEGQRHNDQIMRFIYDPVHFAHKTGELDYLNHDLGVMSIDNDYYFGVSIYDAKDINGNKELVGKIARTIFNYLTKF